ncbi:MAG: ATP-binding protein, partial [Parcubacteria group bacterium]|nr:ATP-binding protein [Parcubacteria group bacterium]
MKIIKFRIKNYKSIKDSEDCYFDPKITILAGKNEAGKTAIVEALEDFNINKDIREESIPISNKLLEPEIELLAELDKEDIEKINQEFNLDLKIIKKNGLLLTIKKIYPKNYTILDDSFTDLIPDKKALIEKIIKLAKFFKEKIINFPFGGEDVEKLDLLPDLKNYTPQFVEGLIEEEQN